MNTIKIIKPKSISNGRSIPFVMPMVYGLLEAKGHRHQSKSGKKKEGLGFREDLKVRVGD